MPGGALAEVVDRAEHVDRARVNGDVQLRVVGADDGADAGSSIVGEDADERVAAVDARVGRGDGGGIDATGEHRVRVDQHAARERNDVRREHDRRVDARCREFLRDLGLMPMAVEAVRPHVVVDFGEERRRRRRPARAGDAALGVDDDLHDLYRQRRERPQRKQRRGRVTARIGDERRLTDRVA